MKYKVQISVVWDKSEKTFFAMTKIFVGDFPAENPFKVPFEHNDASSKSTACLETFAYIQGLADMVSKISLEFGGLMDRVELPHEQDVKDFLAAIDSPALLGEEQ